MHKDDEKWVTEQIKKVSDIKLRQRAKDGYDRVYLKAFDSEPIEHRKIGKARKAANTALRKFVDKCRNWSE